MEVVVQKPLKEEYAPYYETYISKIEEGDIVDIVEKQQYEIRDFFDAMEQGKGNYKYASDKWTIKEIMGHLIDAERVFSYRLLRFVRNDKTPLASYDHDIYAKQGHFNERTIEDLLQELLTVRKSTITLLQTLKEEDWIKTGVANNFTISVRALAYVIAGHIKHHLDVIRERYL